MSRFEKILTRVPFVLFGIGVTLWITAFIYVLRAQADETPIPPVPPACSIIQLDFDQPGMKHPGRAVWNMDGSWSVNWDSVEEEAARQDRNVNDPRLAIARALLKAKQVGLLYESPMAAHTCLRAVVPDSLTHP
jgi:hypothetical protein